MPQAQADVDHDRVLYYDNPTEWIQDFYCCFEDGQVNRRLDVKEQIIISPQECIHSLEQLEHQDMAIATQAAKELVVFAQGHGLHTRSRPRPGGIFEQLQRNTRFIIQSGGLGPVVLYLRRVLLSSQNDLDLDELQYALTLVFLCLSTAATSTSRGIPSHSHELLTLAESTLSLCFNSIQNRHHELKGFPTKRMLLLIYVWIYSITTDHRPSDTSDTTEGIIKSRSKPEHSHNPRPKSSPGDRLAIQTCLRNTQDPMLRYTRHVHQERLEIINHHVHMPFADREEKESESKQVQRLVTIDTLYQVLDMSQDKMNFILHLFRTCSGKALHAQELALFTIRPTSLSKDTHEDMVLSTTFRHWIQREVQIVMNVLCQLMLVLYSRFRLAHTLKSQVFKHRWIDAELVPLWMKFLNKDFVAYTSIPVSSVDNSAAGRRMHSDGVVKSLQSHYDTGARYSLDRVRILTGMLRLIQKSCKDNPVYIQNYLVRPNSISIFKVGSSRNRGSFAHVHE